MLWWICWVCVFKHARHQLKKKKHIHWVKNQSNQTPHSIFTQHKTHFGYAKKKKINHIHSSKHTHLPRKKRKKELSKKSKTIKQNPDEKIKESTYIQKPQMRIHLIWFYSSLSQSQTPARREREREREQWDSDLFLEWLIGLILRKREILYIYIFLDIETYF